MKYGISRRIVAFAKALVGSYRWLGALTVLACMMVAAMSDQDRAAICSWHNYDPEVW